MKIMIPHMFLTVPGGRKAYADFLATIPDELPRRAPEAREVKEIGLPKAPRIILHMLSCGKTVFADQRLLNDPHVLDYLTSEMLDRLYCVETRAVA